MAKTLSPIGNIMNLLHLSPTQLANHLEIDKTTVSKWRTGSRKISLRSPFIEPLVLYFTEINDKNKQHPLDTFFRGLYSVSGTEAADFLPTCLKRYIFSSQPASILPVQSENMIPSPKSAAVFRGYEGRKNTMNMLLSIAEGLQPPCEIKILELDQVEWLCRDMSFLQNFVCRLDLLAKKGCRVEICYSAEKDTPEFRILLGTLETLMYNQNYHVVIVRTEYIEGIAPSIYAIGGHFTAIGFDCDGESDDIYTNIFFDTFTNSKYLSLYSKIIGKYGSPLAAGSGDTVKKSVFDKFDISGNTPSETMYYGSFLSVTTMDEDLLLEILNQNNLTGEEISLCCQFYQNLRKSMEKSPADSGARYYVDIRMIESALAYDSIMEHELAAILSRQVVKTRAQYLRQLEQTARWIRRQPNVKIALVGGYNYPGNTSCTWVKKSMWCLALNFIYTADQNQFIFFEDDNMIKILEDMCNQVKVNFSLEFSGTDYVAGFFEKLVSSCSNS